MQGNEATARQALRETRAWVRHAVIGLNLCPFAKAPQSRERIRYIVTGATTTEALLEALGEELAHLVACDETAVETTLLIHPWVLDDFLAFNDFLGAGDALIADADLEGVIQLASFHPRYQFADTRADDPGNATNRSPYPTLHLLRESSVARAVEAFPDTDAIFTANIDRLERLGSEGWSHLQRLCRDEAASATEGDA